MKACSMRSFAVACLVALVPVSGAYAQKPAAAAQAVAPQWVIDQKASSIAFSGVHAGNKFAGTFKSWSGDIRFDPARLPASKAVILVQTASAFTGNRTYDGTLPDQEWLNPKAFPNARFETTAIRSLGANRYEADGRLTIKKTTLVIKLPFTLSIANNVATMKGTAMVDRLALDIGKGSDPSAEWVSKQIKVDITVRAVRR